VDSIEYDRSDTDENWYFYIDEVVPMEDINYADVIGQVGEI